VCLLDPSVTFAACHPSNTRRVSRLASSAGFACAALLPSHCPSFHPGGALVDHSRLTVLSEKYREGLVSILLTLVHMTLMGFWGWR
jgi:hypothetical protein